MRQKSQLFYGLLVFGICLVQLVMLSGQSENEVINIVFPDSNQVIQTVGTGRDEMIALEDVARVFGVAVEENSTANTATVIQDDNVVILTENQQLVSVAGRLISLSTAPRLSSGRWLIPLDFLTRALAPLLDQPLSLRSRSRLVVVGDAVVPRISAQYLIRDQIGQLTFEVTPSTPFTITRDDTRLTLRFEADALDVVQMPRIRGGLVNKFEARPFRSELLMDLGPLFDEYSESTDQIDEGTEIVLELLPRNATANSDSLTVPLGLTDAAPSTVSELIPVLRTEPSVQLIAIDAGHGGSDEGTLGNDGTAEKDITLSVAQRLRDAVEQRLGLQVVLTRFRDDTVPLDQRAAIANNNKADLFVSLHVNASIRPSANGAEVFYLSMDEYGAEARALAQRDTQLIPVIGGGFRSIDLVQWEMAQVSHLEQSAHLADIVYSELGRRIPMSSRGVQEAPFRVLVGANMPAVLIEMGFLSNEQDERRLTSARFQNAVVNALVESIIRFRQDVEESVDVGHENNDSESMGGSLLPSNREN